MASVGNCSCDGRTRTAQTHDRFPAASLAVESATRALDIRLDPQTGLRVLGDVRPPPRGFDGWLNSAGVARNCTLRCPRPSVDASCAHGFGDARQYLLLEYAMPRTPDRSSVGPEPEDGSRVLFAARSADEAITMLTSNLPRSRLVMQRPVHDGPTAFGNAFVSRHLRRHERYPWGVARARRAREMLASRAASTAGAPFDCDGITTPFLFRVLRDHGLGFDLSYAYDDRGNISTLSYGHRTVFAEVCEIDEQPDLLGLLWATPSFPPTSPFLPFFMGLPEIPAPFGPGPENATGVFAALLAQVQDDPERIDAIQRFWEGFEHRVLTELMKLRRGVTAACESGDRSRAADMLLAFTADCCGNAVRLARRLLERGDGRASSEWRGEGEGGSS